MSSSCWAHGLRLEAETTARGALTCLLTEGFVQFGLSLLFAIFFNKAINTKLLPTFDVNRSEFSVTVTVRTQQLYCTYCRWHPPGIISSITIEGTIVVSVMNLQLLCVICLQLLLIVSLCEGKKKKTKKSSDGKQSDTSSSSSSAISASIRNIQELSTIFEHEHTAVLFDKNFSSFVSDRPREYYAALLFTATGSKYRCSICLKVKPIFDDVAKLYNEQYEFNSSAIDKRIAFFRVEVDNARNIFSAMVSKQCPIQFVLLRFAEMLTIVLYEYDYNG